VASGLCRCEDDFVPRGLPRESRVRDPIKDRETGSGIKNDHGLRRLGIGSFDRRRWVMTKLRRTAGRSGIFVI